MQETNWNNFKAKFNGKEQTTFEWFCYLLFCREFNQPSGVFRYINQAGIETNPIEVEGKYIGWTAKFYEVNLTERKDEILDAIQKTNEYYPEVTRLLFYSNKDWGQNKGKPPKGLTEIENKAKKYNITLDWRLSSHFDAPLVCEENANIAQHFFSLDKSIIDFLNELTNHTEAILAAINSNIKFNGNEIKIDRSESIKNLRNILSVSPMAILSGKAGVGKTAIIKDFYKIIKETVPFYLFRAHEFNVTNINQVFSNYGSFTLSDFVKEHQGYDEKYMIIDSSEKLSDIEDKESFQEFLATLQSNKWNVIFTTRHSFLDELMFQFINIYQISCQPIEIDKLSSENLREISNNYNFDLPNNERLHELLQTPFYLGEYLQNYSNLGSSISFSEFKNLLWRKQISKTDLTKNNIHIKREECFIQIAHRRATEGKFFVKAKECDDDVLQRLEEDEIIKYDSNSGGYFITHDIYEEWALDKVIERAFLNSKECNAFFSEIGSSLPIRRAFRYWISNKLIENQIEAKSFIEKIINNCDIESHWKDEIYVSILLSDYAEVFFKLFEKTLLEENYALLIRIIFLLRIACKEVDDEFLKLLGISKTGWRSLKIIFTKPRCQYGLDK